MYVYKKEFTIHNTITLFSGATMKISVTSSLLFLIAAVTAVPHTKDANSARKRTPAVLTKFIADYAAAIGGGIVAGASLIGTTSKSLSDPSYSVTVSGAIENFAKYTMNLKKCHVEDGYVNVPLRSIAPGSKEGFASHKAGHAAKGTYVLCTYKMKGTLLHIMFSDPYSYNHYENRLGFAICPEDNDKCKGIDADDIYYKYSTYAKVQKYYGKYKPLKLCHGDFCLHGIMGTTHKTDISVKLYPKNYSDLSEALKSTPIKERYTKDDYEKFVKEL